VLAEAVISPCPDIDGCDGERAGAACPGDVNNSGIAGGSEFDHIGHRCRRGRDQESVEPSCLWRHIGVGTEEEQVAVNGRKGRGRGRYLGNDKALRCARQDIDRRVERTGQRGCGVIKRRLAYCRPSSDSRPSDRLAAQLGTKRYPLP
jgi:hypothetical protein